MCVSVVVVVLVMCAGVVVFNCQGRRFVVPSLCSFSSGHLLAERREGVEGTERGGAGQRRLMMSDKDSLAVFGLISR